MMETKQKNNLLLGILFLSFLMNVNGIWVWGKWHPDELFNYIHHMGPLSNWRPLTLKYPSLALYLYRIAGVASFEILIYKLHLLSPFNYLWTGHVISRLISGLMGTMAVFWMFKIGEFIGKWRVGILSAAFLAFLPLFVNLAHFGTTDVPHLMWILAAMYFILKCRKTFSWKNSILSGIFIGLAISTKYFGGVLLAPLIASALINQHDKKSEIFIRLMISIALIVLSFALTTPYFFIGPTLFWNDMSSVYKARFPETEGAYYIFKMPIRVLKISEYWLGVIAIIGMVLTVFRSLATRKRVLPLWVAIGCFASVLGLCKETTLRLNLPLVVLMLPFSALGIHYFVLINRKRKILKAIGKYVLFILFIVLVLKALTTAIYFYKDTRIVMENAFLNSLTGDSVIAYNKVYWRYYPRVERYSKTFDLSNLRSPTLESAEKYLIEEDVNYILASSFVTYQTSGIEHNLYKMLRAGDSEYNLYEEYVAIAPFGVKPIATEFINPRIAVYKQSETYKRVGRQE